MTSFSIDSSERRRAFRFAIHHQSRLRVTLEGDDGGEDINGVLLTDISQQGLMAAGAGHLVPGALVMLEVPLVGWREAEVMWITENRAGCRFTEPLSFDELRRAAASSERLALECPTLTTEIADLPLVEEATVDLATDDTDEAKPWLLPVLLTAFALLVALGFILAY